MTAFDKRVGFVGAGKVGFTLGKLFAESGIAVSGYSSSNAADAEAAAAFTNSHAFGDARQVVDASDVVFFTVPDGAIADAWEALVFSYGNAAFDALFGKVVCHCSGSLSSGEFANAAKYGASAASVHPLYAISNKEESYKTVASALFTLEGDGAAVAAAANVLDACGARHREIASRDKALYHAAAVCASNLAAGLFGSAQVMLEHCGFGADEARQALSPLFVDNCEAVAARGPIDALTGPIERNDFETVTNHLLAFSGDPTLLKQRDAYTALSRVVLELAAAKHPDRDYSQLADVLRAARK